MVRSLGISCGKVSGFVFVYRRIRLAGREVEE